MKIKLAIPSIIAIMLFTSCGRKLEGVYVEYVELPAISMMGHTQKPQTMTTGQKLVFKGGKVEINDGFMVTSYPYKIKGNNLIIKVKVMNQPTELHLKLNEDGTITLSLPLGNVVYRRK